MENFAKETKRDKKNIQTIYDYICIIFYVYLYDGNAYNLSSKKEDIGWNDKWMNSCIIDYMNVSI